MIKPNAFIIGAPKCGTTALAKYLGEHPNVFFSNPKEIFYWCSDFRRGKHEMMIESLSDYLELFSEADPEMHQIVAEGSTRYLQSTVAIANILNFNPQAKFIAMLRNPVELVQAYHMEQRYSLHEDVDSFEEAWRLQPQRARGEEIPRECRAPALLQYGEVGALGAQIRSAMAIIPDGQLKVILIEDMKRDAATVYRDVLDFLRLPDDGRSEFPVVNAAHGHRYEWLAKLVLTPPKAIESLMLRLRQHLLHNRYPPIEWLKSKLNQKAERDSISGDFHRELQDYFRDDVSLLSSLIGRDLSGWVAGQSPKH